MREEILARGHTRQGATLVTTANRGRSPLRYLNLNLLWNFGRRTAPSVAKERYDGEVSTCVNGLVDTSGGGSSRVSLAELDEYSRGVSDSTR